MWFILPIYDAGHIMGEGEPFEVTFWEKDGRTTYSLRSSADGIDVSEIAKQFGGGGHAHAVGYKVTTKGNRK